MISEHGASRIKQHLCKIISLCENGDDEIKEAALSALVYIPEIERNESEEKPVVKYTVEKSGFSDSVSLKNEDGNTICAGCKDPLDLSHAYAYSHRDVTTIYYFFVHKRCRPTQEEIQEWLKTRGGTENWNRS